jgi:hypothetical protein
MERIAKYRDTVECNRSWPRLRCTPLTVVYMACIGMALAMIAYVVCNPAVDAGKLAGV